MTITTILAALIVGQGAGPLPRAVFRGAPETRTTQPASAPACQPESEVDVLAIEREWPHDPERCVQALLVHWEQHGGQAQRAIVSACERATPETTGMILESADRVLATVALRPRHPALGFFGRPARILSVKMLDPKPLLELAMKYGCWEMITRYECDREMKERYLLDGLRRCETLRCDPSTQSLARYITSEDAIAQLVRTMRELRKRPSWKGFDIALRTLVELDERTIIDDVARIVQDDALSAKQRADAEVYLAKLRYQHSVKDLTNIVRTERKNRGLLIWAVRRLLWLKTDRKVIYDALATNQRTCEDSCEVVAGVEEYIRACEKHDLVPVKTQLDFDVLMFDHEEQQAYFDALDEAANVRESLIIFSEYTLPSLVRSAPRGD